MLTIKKSWLCVDCNMVGTGKTTAKTHVRMDKHEVTYMEHYKDEPSTRRQLGPLGGSV